MTQGTCGYNRKYFFISKLAIASLFSHKHPTYYVIWSKDQIPSGSNAMT